MLGYELTLIGKYTDFRDFETISPVDGVCVISQSNNILIVEVAKLGKPIVVSLCLTKRRETIFHKIGKLFNKLFNWR